VLGASGPHILIVILIASEASLAAWLERRIRYSLDARPHLSGCRPGPGRWGTSHRAQDAVRGHAPCCPRTAELHAGTARPWLVAESARDPDRACDAGAPSLRALTLRASTGCTGALAGALATAS
jgi:hypothetical protein